MVRKIIYEAPERLYDRALGAYLGLAIGDALGATVEFMTPREIAHQFAREGGVHRQIIGGGWLKLEAGEVTDDTTMSLAIGEAILKSAHENRLFDTTFIADAFVTWWRSKPVDCGDTCRRGIVRYMRDGSLHGVQTEGDAGNGALMRNLPVIIAALGDGDTFERVSLAQARITHHHPLSDAAVIGIGHLARRILVGENPHIIQNYLTNWIAQWPKFSFQPYPGRASGYVVDTVQTVLHAYSIHRDFEEAVVAAVNRGEDADTTGALVGMLAGARCGAQALPSRWVRRLNRDIVRAITDQTSALLAIALTPSSRQDSP
ncbi:MAG: ADP-ribosyl-[dinitrogen reductase] hydrolase [Oxalobacter sp.]|jgi:ADP-ribosyl-[dinitrogen reductase] hydrolase|nr:MAG: ADP-ribosyl-[dinitrogen reductase] hydrolase [Oxalobacter sp.]